MEVWGTKIVLIVFILIKQTVAIATTHLEHPLNQPATHWSMNSTRGTQVEGAEKWKINSKLWVVKIIKLIYFIWYKNDIRASQVCLSVRLEGEVKEKMEKLKCHDEGWKFCLFIAIRRHSSTTHPLRFSFLPLPLLLLATEFIHSAEPLTPNIF